MNKSRFIGVALAVTLWLATGALAAELRVMASGPGHLRLEFAAQPGGRALTTGRSWLVGLPLRGEVELEVVETEGRVEEDEWGADVERGERVLGPAQLGKEGFIRGQRVVELVFGPRLIADGGVEVFDRIVVDLRFTDEGGGEGFRRADRWGEVFLRQVLVNYEQARGWRLPRRRSAAKTIDLDADMTLVRLLVREEGMYRISGAELRDAGVDLGEVDPARLRLFYGGGRPLKLTELGKPVERQEIAAVVEDGGDGRFDAEDFVLFYGEPASRWEYEGRGRRYTYLHNLYTHDNVYWLGVGGGEERREPVVRGGALRESESQRPQSYRMRVHEEFEQFILVQTYTINSGYEWYWEEFHGNARNYPVLIREAVDEPVDIRFGFWGLSSAGAWFTVKWNDTDVGQVSIPSVGKTVQTARVAGGVQEGLNQLGLFHTSTAPARLDWYELEYSRGFTAERGELLFDFPADAGVTEFRLNGFAAERPRIFEVSEDMVEIVDFEYDAEAGSVVFQDAAGERPRRYAVSGPARWKRPVKVEVDASSHLQKSGQGAEYLIITHPDFRDAAERLASWRAADARFGTPLITRVVDVQDIYDEFSGGMLDPGALRSFLVRAAEAWEPAPFFVLLLGDGTYDYKNNSGTSPGNWIPAYQDDESTYDEWYAQVYGNDILPDMAIGRLPVQTAAEADIVVDKLVDYDRQPDSGPWQGRVLLVADDLSNPEHPENIEAMFLLDAEYLARNLLPDDLDLRKLYLAQYPLEGRTKPRAHAEFIRRFNEGALILTYLGHGNPDVLAHERMFVVSRDLGEIANGRRLPFFYTAASQVGVFDDPLRVSMPEALLKRRDGGVVGMISATRVGFHDSNMILANAFHEQMYHSGREHVPVGLALMEAKQRVQVYTAGLSQTNIRRYSLFGDPATRLARPRYQVEIAAPDSLRALEEVRIDGQILDAQSQPAADFTGQAWIQAFDSSVESRLNGMRYEQVGVALFRGLFPVQGGRFSALFRVPKDITYRGTDGRISAYVWGNGDPPAFGAVQGLVLAGTAEGVEIDQEGPQIRIGFAGQENFTDGGRIPPNAVLHATVGDPSGINVTGETGHEIELSVDREVFEVTEFFSVQGDYREGILEYSLKALEPGEHEIRLKAWDSFNNSARAEMRVQVSEGDDMVLADLLFHPNPLRGDAGHFTFNLALPVTSAHIQIFALSGRLVDEVASEVRSGFNQIAWRPSAELANGSYLYRVQVEREDGSEIVRSGVIQVVK